MKLQRLVVAMEFSSDHEAVSFLKKSGGDESTIPLSFFDIPVGISLVCVKNKKIYVVNNQRDFEDLSKASKIFYVESEVVRRLK